MSGLCLAQGQPLYSSGHSIGQLLDTLSDRGKESTSFRAAASLSLSTDRHSQE